MIRVRDDPDPKPAPGEVLIRLEAAPIHIADLLAIRGELDVLPDGQSVPGFEGIGRVVATNGDVGPWRAGDRAILPTGYGACRELHAVSPACLLRAPGEGDAAALSLARINLSTAWLLLFGHTVLRRGDRAIQNAANSNVGRFVCDLAREDGIEIVSVVRRKPAAQAMRDAGNGPVLVDGPDLAERVAALGGPPPRIGFDAVGGEATARIGQCVENGALVLSYGFLSRQPHGLAYRDLMFRDVKLAGVMTDRSMAAIGTARVAQMHRRMEAFLASGDYRAEIAGVYPFSRAADAYRHAARTGAQRQGKVILVPD